MTTLDLGLNIVATTTEDTAADNNTTNQAPPPKKKKKKKNKYEKRRRKAADAKLLAKQQHQNAVGEEDVDLDAERTAMNRILTEAADEIEAAPSMMTAVVPLKNPQESERETLRDLDDDDNHQEEEDTTKEETLLKDTQQQQQKRQQTEAEHAAYMAEYHARPLELDRRNGATTTVLVKSSTNNAAARRKLKKEAAKQQKDNTSSHDIDVEVEKNDNKKEEEDDLFASHTQWSDLPLDAKIVNLLTPSKGSSSSDHISSLGYDRPTHIQERVIRAALSTSSHSSHSGKHKNKNIWVQSETGSGKTMAYFLPILQHLWQHLHQHSNTTSRSELGTQCLIVCPTQELVQQTHRALEQLVQKVRAGTLVVGSFCAQTSRSKEKARIRKGLTVLVSTPGRLLDHLKTTQSLQVAVGSGNLKWLVLDEVDRLFDMGLAPQLQDVIRLLKDYTTAGNASSSSSGPRNNAHHSSNSIPWRSILVSATVPKDVQTLVQAALSPSSESNSSVASSKEWVWIQGDNHQNQNGNKKSTKESSDNNTAQSGRSLPKQLVQYHITVSAKLRLTTLIAFLADRVANNERTVVFMSTCASVDYYHALLATYMEPIMSKKKNHNKDNSDDDDNSNTNANQGSGIFGSACSIHKLHGNVPHRQRHAVLETFQQQQNNRNKNAARSGARILLATDVAARGLNLQADWTVQYDPPCEIADYIHRAGRVARAGQFGQSLLFLLPSEKSLLNILQLQQQQSQSHNKSGEPPPPVREMPALSLTSTLQRAAKVCPDMAHQGMQRNGMRSRQESSGVADTSAGPGGGASQKGHRLGEAFCSELQYRLEECVLQHSKPPKDNEDTSNLSAAERKKRKQKKKTTKEASEMTLADMARSAFLSHMRAYPTKEKLVRHIFSARALHLGHIAKSFALRETPKTLVKNSRGVLEEPGKTHGKKRNASLAFSTQQRPDGDDLDEMKHNSAAQKRAMLMANAAKLQLGGVDGF